MKRKTGTTRKQAEHLRFDLPGFVKLKKKSRPKKSLYKRRPS